MDSQERISAWFYIITKHKQNYPNNQYFQPILPFSNNNHPKNVKSKNQISKLKVVTVSPNIFRDNFITSIKQQSTNHSQQCNKYIVTINRKKQVIGSAQTVLKLMEPQEKQEPHNISIRFYKDLAMNNQTTKCSFGLSNSLPSQYDIESCSNSPNDLSFQIQIHKQNVEVIKVAATKYLQSCLLGGYSKDLGFKDSSLYLYKQRPCLQKEGSVLDTLISHNILFKQEMKKDIFMILKEEQNLTRFLKEIPENFGLTVGKELTFIIYQILKEKNQKYKQIFTPKEGILPKITCFQGYQDQICQQLSTQCPVYEQIEIEEVATFAESGIEVIAKNLYFADTNIKILNLKQITAECNPKVDLIKQFIVLIRQISRSVFLTLAGGTQPASTFTSLFDTKKEFSMIQFCEMQMPINKSLSRSAEQYNKDQIFDFLSKKTKL